MREPTPAQSIRLTDQQTLHDTMIVARRHIPLTATGYRCQTGNLWRLLLAAAARHTTIEAACADLTGVPDANTVRGYLTEQLSPTGIPDLEQQWNDLLRTLVPDWLRGRPQELAVDFHDEPYYGRDDPDDPDTWVCRGEARAGTTRFYRCATAYLMLHDVRLTLAVVFVKPKTDKLAISSACSARFVRHRSRSSACMPIKASAHRGAALSLSPSYPSHSGPADPWQAGWQSSAVSWAEELLDDLYVAECRGGEADCTSGSRANLSAPSLGPAPAA
jgi:hypothetical protein